MFRQHLVSCNCQLFSPHHYEFKDFRSPPAHTNRKETKQKRSLKSQSHSRNRIMHQQSKFLRNSQRTQLQNDKNIKVVLLPSRQTSTLAAQSEYQFKPMPAPLAKITLLNSKSDRKQTHQVSHKQNFPKGCPVKSIRYQTRISSPEPGQHIEIFKDITLNTNLPQNNHFIRMSESITPGFCQKYPKYTQNSAETTLAGSIVPSNNQYLQKVPARIPHYFQNQYISVINKNSFCEQKTKQRPATHTNFVKLSRLSEMIHDKQETQSVYQSQVAPQQKGVQFSRVLISCKKLMEEQNGVLQQNQRTKLFDYYPQPSKRNNHSSTFQKINLVPSNLR